jgi:ABC-2 type transport system ATP-binding protein
LPADAIALDHVAKAYGRVQAIADLSLSIGSGEMFGLIGPDGAGKTTTIRLICGLLAADKGTVRVLGLDPRREHRKLTDAVGYLSQSFSLYADLSIDENVAFFAEIHGMSDYATRRDRLLEMTQLTPFRSRLAGQLSGGMKQKLALMCTLLHRPQILFLDEPTNGVDPVSRRDFWAILYQLLKDGITIFMTTAYLDEAERCNRVGLLHKGKLIRCSTPEAMKAETGSTNLEGAFIQTIHAVEGVTRT